MNTMQQNRNFSSRIAPLAIMLEPRFMFDGAAVATGVEIVDHTTEQPSVDSEAIAQNGDETAATDDTNSDANEQTVEAANTTSDETNGQTESNKESEEVVSESTGNEEDFSDETTAETDEDTVVTDATDTTIVQDFNEESDEEIVFVDTTVEDYETLVDGLDSDIEVVLLNGDGDEVTQMVDALADHSDIDAIYVISHGSESSVVLGEDTITSDNLEEYREQLGIIGSALSEEGDILLYGCEIASGGGRDFIDDLAEMTGADIAASDDLTGHAELGGDWDLEIATGSIESETPFNDQALKEFSHLLSFTGIIDFTDTADVSDEGGDTPADDFVYIIGASDEFTLKINGVDAGVEFYDAYDEVAVGYGASYYESSASIYFTNGESFTANSITLAYEWSTHAARTFRIEANNGDYATFFIPYDDQSSRVVDLSGFTAGITSLTLSRNDAGTFKYIYIKEIDISNVSSNSAPTITNLNGDSLSYSEGDSATLIDQGTAATVTDGDSADFDGGNLTVTISSGEDAAEDVLSLNTLGSVSLAGTTAGSNVSVSGTVIGTLDNDIAAGNDLVISFNSNATASTAQTLAQAVTYQNTDTDNPTTGARTIRLTVNDGDGGTSSNNDVTVTVSGVNDDPTITGLPSDITVTEDTASNVDLSAATLSDVDSTDADFTLTITAGAGTLTANTGGGVTVSNSGSSAITLTGTASNIDSFLNTASNVQYTGASNVNGNDATTLTITANDQDGSGDVSLGTVNVDITAVNDEPTLSSTGSNPSFIEGGSAVTLFSGTAVSTVEVGQNITSMKLTTTNVASGSNEFLVIDGTSVALTDSNSGTTGASSFNYAVSVSGGTATVTITKTDTTTNYQTLVNGLQYSNNQSDVNSNDRVVTITELVDSGANGGADDNTAALAVASTVSMTNVNDEPTLTATGSNPTFTEGGAAASLFTGTAIDTVESGQNIGELIFTVTNVNDGADESVSVDGTNVALTDSNSGTTAASSFNYLVAVVGTTATVTITKNDSSTNYQTLIDGLAYANANDTPNTSNRVVTITSVKDDGGTANSGDDTNASLSVTSTVAITATNDEPTLIATGSSPSFIEGGSAVTLFSGTAVSTIESGQNITSMKLTTTNVESGANEFLVIDGTSVALTDSNSGTTGASSFNYAVSVSGGTATVTITKTDTTANYQTLVNGLQYSNNQSDVNSNDRVVTITELVDSGANGGADDNTAALAVASTVSMTNVNDEPTLTATGSNPTFTEGGAAASLFTGTAIDTIESTQNIAELIFTVTNVNDGAAESVSVDGTSVALTDSNNGTTGASSFNYSVAVVGSTATVTITKNDSSGNYQTLVNGLAYSNSSDDPTTSNRVVTLTSVKDNGGTANGGDDTNASLSVASTVTVAAVNDTPTISNLDGDSVSFSIGGSAVSLDSGTALSLADLDSANFDGGNVTVSITANKQAAEDQLQVVSSGNITVSGTIITHSDSGGVDIGTVSGNNQSTNELIVTLNANATVARVEDLLDALRYYDSDSATTNTSARTLTITVDDGDGGSSTSASQDVTVNLVRAPIIDLDGDDSTGATNGGYAGSFTEGGGAVAVADSDSSISDDGTFKSLTVTLTNRPDGASESLASTYGSGAQTVNGEAVTIAAYNSGTGVLTITVDDISTDDTTMQMLMESIRYDNSSENPDTTDRTISFSATDNDDNAGSSVNSVISVSGVNDNPTLTGLPSDITVTEDTASNVDLSAATLADVDSTGSDFTLTITAGAGTLTAGSGGGVTVSNSGSSALTLTGTVSNIDTFLDTASNIQYTGTANTNGNDADTLTLTANDQDGSGNVSLGTVNVDITNVDDEPTLTATGDNPNFVLGGSAVSLFSSATISTIEAGQNITQMVFTVTNVSGAGADEFVTLDGTDVALSDGNSGVTGVNTFGYNVSLAGGTATVTIAKSDTALNYQTLVDGIAYSTTLTALDGNDRVATITSLTDNGSNVGSNDNVNATLSVSSTVVLSVQATPAPSVQPQVYLNVPVSDGTQHTPDGSAPLPESSGENVSGQEQWFYNPPERSTTGGGEGNTSSFTQRETSLLDGTTIGQQLGAFGSIIDPDMMDDPSMGIGLPNLVRNAVFGNEIFLDRFYGVELQGNAFGESEPGTLGSGIDDCLHDENGICTESDFDYILGMEGFDGDHPQENQVVSQDDRAPALYDELHTILGKPSFSRQLVDAALQQEDARWGALAGVLMQPTSEVA